MGTGTAARRLAAVLVDIACFTAGCVPGLETNMEEQKVYWQAVFEAKNGAVTPLDAVKSSKYFGTLETVKEVWAKHPNSSNGSYRLLGWLPFDTWISLRNFKVVKDWENYFGCGKGVVAASAKPRREPDHAPNWWDLPKVTEDSAKKLGEDYMAAVRASSGDKGKRA